MAKYIRTVGALSTLALLAGCSSGMAVPSSTAAKSQLASASPSSAKSAMPTTSPGASTTSAKSTSAVSSAAPSSAGKAYLKDGVVYGDGYSYKLPANYTFNVPELGNDTKIRYSGGGIVIFTALKPADPLDTSCGVRDRYMESVVADPNITEIKMHHDIVIDGVTACGFSLQNIGSSLLGYFVVHDEKLYLLAGVSTEVSIVQRYRAHTDVAKSWKWK